MAASSASGNRRQRNIPTGDVLFELPPPDAAACLWCGEDRRRSSLAAVTGGSHERLTSEEADQSCLLRENAVRHASTCNGSKESNEGDANVYANVSKSKQPRAQQVCLAKDVASPALACARRNLGRKRWRQSLNRKAIPLMNVETNEVLRVVSGGLGRSRHRKLLTT